VSIDATRLFPSPRNCELAPLSKALLELLVVAQRALPVVRPVDGSHGYTPALLGGIADLVTIR
jgi:hypothetical protein